MAVVGGNNEQFWLGQSEARNSCFVEFFVVIFILFYFNLGSVASLFVFGAEGFGVRGFVPFGNHGETSCRCRTAVASER